MKRCRARQCIWARAAMLAILAAVPGVPVSAADTAPAPAPAPPHLTRPNLLVADIERALTIYRDILGFQAGTTIVSGPESYSYEIFQLPHDARLRFIFLSAGPDQHVMALTEAKGAARPAASTPYDDAVIIELKQDLTPVIARLKAAGLSVGNPVKLTTPTGQKRTDVSFTDFDGHRVVLFGME